MSSWQGRIIRLYLNYIKFTGDYNDPIEKLRQVVDGGARFGKFPKSVQSENMTIENIPAELIIPPKADGHSALLYLHGGGYATGSIKSHRAAAGQIADAGNIRTLIIDYRRPPENPFPAALEDALAAYDWLRKNGYERIVITGDSAGGGLALTTVISLRDNQRLLPSLVICLSPLIDVECTGESVLANSIRDPWLTTGMKTLFNYYVAQNDPRNPLISPLYADFTNLPPIMIYVGMDEILLSDSTRLAEKAKDAGVDVQINIWPGMWHVFPFFAPFAPEAARAVTEIGDAIKHRIRMHMDTRSTGAVEGQFQAEALNK
jgi:acetyl esterase/lipase